MITMTDWLKKALTRKITIKTTQKKKNQKPNVLLEKRG